MALFTIASRTRTARASALALALGSFVTLAGCGGEPTVLEECVAADGLEVLCGFRNPEDLALLPGGAWLLASELPQESAPFGHLVAVRLSNGSRRELFPPAAGRADLSSRAPSEGWGDPQCPGPPDRAAFAPHGIDLVENGTAGSAIAVVNHGGRETIELFQLAYAEGGPALAWRGCIVAPSDASLNDVAWLPDGGLVTTKMLPRAEGAAMLFGGLAMLVGANTGHVLEWQPDRGWSVLAGSEGNAPNGIVVSADGSAVYYSEWGSGKLVRIRRGGDAGPERAEVSLPHHPDNLTWSRDGRIVVTGQDGRLGDVAGCFNVEVGTCGLPFSIYIVDPITLEAELLLQHSGRATGAGTVALQVGEALYIGTFRGDRIARAVYPQ